MKKEQYLYVTRDKLPCGEYNFHLLEEEIVSKKKYRERYFHHPLWRCPVGEGEIPEAFMSTRVFHALFTLRLRPGSGPVLIAAPVTLEREGR